MNQATAKAALKRFNRGNSLFFQTRPAEALTCYDQAIALMPNYAEALNNRGVALSCLGRLAEALASYDRALALKPNYTEALNNRGVALSSLGRLVEAMASYDHALALKPGYPQALYNRGIVFVRLGRHAEALSSLDRALALTPDYPDALTARGAALISLGRFAEALACLDRTLALNPHHPMARYDRSVLFLQLGRFAEGWAAYESRWAVPGVPPPALGPVHRTWSGQDLVGKRIIVYCEQGFGDTIQFARYLPMLAALGADVTCLADPLAVRLLRSLGSPAPDDHPPVHVVPALSSRQPFDFQCALLSLPLGFGTVLKTIPADIPYLFPPPDLLARWRQRIDPSGFKVGICWQGRPSHKNDCNRSIPLRQFRALAGLPGIRLFSLQKNDGLDQLPALADEFAIDSLGSDIEDFADTAAAMACLDLVVTADTSVAHLAGALGRPVWVVLPHAAEWRWLLDRSDSPWYPTMRLYRQDTWGDWEGVFRRIAGDLRMASSAASMLDRNGSPVVCVQGKSCGLENASLEENEAGPAIHGPLQYLQTGGPGGGGSIHGAVVTPTGSAIKLMTSPRISLTALSICSRGFYS